MSNVTKLPIKSEADDVDRDIASLAAVVGNLTGAVEQMDGGKEVQ